MKNVVTKGQYWTGIKASSDFKLIPFKIHVAIEDLINLSLFKAHAIKLITENYPHVDFKYINDNMINASVGIQQYKSFVVYPDSIENFKNLAKDLDDVCFNLFGSSDEFKITGDRKIPSKSGRIFYRYEFDTVELKDIVITQDNLDIYNNHYEPNRNHDNYLSADFDVSLDPFLNFNLVEGSEANE